ncbi:protein kinase [Nocardia sp. NPDC127579]|uniref:serine/threonine-protein kinase n=1 Tax=Nocardia sp. NPDC127579 TaxID=3345402 RepID=UPI00363D8621
MISGRTVVDGRFELIEPLGSGGMGTVWRALDVMLHRDVALKEVRPDVSPGASSPAVQRERVLREARALARIGHPNVVALHHIVNSESETHPWLVMELVRGQSLADRLTAGPLPVAVAARLGRGVLAGLRAAHAVGVLHRDVKPANVMLREDGSPVLTDFGIAAIDGLNGLTSTGHLVGSLEYVAPERLGGQEGLPASDLWSLGLVLYVAVEGFHPMRRETTVAILAAVLAGEVPPPRRAGALTPLLEALLVPDPARRPTAEQVDQLLAQALSADGPTPPAAPRYAEPEATTRTSVTPAEGYRPTPQRLESSAPHPPANQTSAPHQPAGQPPASHTPAGQSPASHTPAGQSPAQHSPSALPQSPGRYFASAIGADHRSAPRPPLGRSSAPQPLAEHSTPSVQPIDKPTATPASRTRRAVFAGLTLAVAIAGGTTIALWRSPEDTVGQPPATSRAAAAVEPGSPSAEPDTGTDLFDPAALRTAIAAIEKLSGSLEFTETRIYPDRVSTGAPLADRPSVYDLFEYDRDIRAAERTGPGGQLTDATIRLGTIDWDLIPALFRTAEQTLNVPKPTIRYIMVDPTWAHNDDKPTLLFYLIDDYSAAYLAVNLDGSFVSSYPASPGGG